ncbi:hypothetical protein FNV43_RR09736 [Rhamnella rubrinervis]|uniref:Uncharacterized protein n=1 Tax=Rhamnella rubrinervis TaxID=2594499 RepID=A0A8K0HAI3_9ROSA|nr:hypothetical protein FNV43_RR09736 [Rhamnella rubrinervis]
MGKQSKPKKPESFGKGKVTPMQIAFIVDRYLSNNHFSETRSLFRTEASSLISRSPVQEAPKSLLSLETMLNEYVCLKEQKVMVDQERVRLDQEKCRVQTLLQGMQNVMSAYNASGSPPTPAISAAVAAQPLVLVPQTRSFSGSPAGFPVHKTPIVQPVSTPSNINSEPANFLSPITNQPSSIKRKVSKIASDAPPAAKKSRGKLSAQKFPDKEEISSSCDAQTSVQPSCALESASNNCAPNGSSVNGSSVAKCLFNQPSVSNPINSSCPSTPPQENSSQNDKSISPEEITREDALSSPVKTNLKRQTKKDVKGRLDFDGSYELTTSSKPIAEEISTSESEKDLNIFDIDLPNLDAIGVDFCFTEMLENFDFECEEIGYSCQPPLSAPVDSASGSPPESLGGNMGVNQVMSEFLSTVTEVLKDVNVQGPDSMTAMKSITTSIKIISPVKNCGNSSDQNCSARN